MKKFRNGLAARAAAVAIGLSALAGTAPGSEKPVVSARPGQRSPRELPPAAQGGVPLSLEQAIGLALADNKDLDITINFAESSRFSLFQTHGIFDPLAAASMSRAHTEQPATSQLVGAAVNT